MGQFRVAFPTNHFDAATAFYRTHLAADTVTEWDDETRGVVLQVAGEGCVELFDAGPGTGAAPVGLIISIELHSTTAVDDLHSQLSLVAPVTTGPGRRLLGSPHLPGHGPQRRHRGLFWAPPTARLQPTPEAA